MFKIQSDREKQRIFLSVTSINAITQKTKLSHQSITNQSFQVHSRLIISSMLFIPGEYVPSMVEGDCVIQRYLPEKVSSDLSWAEEPTDIDLKDKDTPGKHVLYILSPILPKNFFKI